MFVAYPNPVDADHLEEVKAAMMDMGSPEIRAYYNADEDWYYTIEGSHRVVAAHELGIAIDFVEVDWDDEITGHDFPDLPETVTVEEIYEYCYGRRASNFVSFED